MIHKNISIKERIFLLLSSFTAAAVFMPTQMESAAIFVFLIMIAAAATALFLPFEWEKYNKSKRYPLCLIFGGICSFLVAEGAYRPWLASGMVTRIASKLHLSNEIFLILSFFLAGLCGITMLILTVYFYENNSGSNRTYGIIVLSAFYVYICTQDMICGQIAYPGPVRILLGVACILTLISLVITVTGNYKPGLLFGTLPFMLYGTIDNYVYRFRGDELRPLDFRSTHTALNVIGGYDLTPPLLVLICWLGWILWIMLVFLSERSEQKNKRIHSSIACLIILVLIAAGIGNISARTYLTTGSLFNGTVLNFIIQVRDSFVKKPEGYSDAVIASIEKQYEPAGIDLKDKEQMPSIIVIMNESFTDFDSYNTELKTECELLPFIHGLKKNTVRGYAYSSVFGGNTPNSEFEFLTGNTMAFLPPGSVPYQQYISGEQYSILSVLHSLGYECVATHPYDSSGWNRPEVYRAFGFDECTFLDSYPVENLVRGYVSDQEMFRFITDRYETRDRNRNFFLFGITMQNHGGYTNHDFTSTVTLNYENEYPEAEQFMSLTQLSDQALSYLISYFANIEEPVVICFFGDHQPSIELDFYTELQEGNTDSLNSEEQKYKIPFFVWANYDIEEESDIETSLNYLSNYVFKVADIGMPPYNQFLSDIQETIPVINSQAYYSCEQGKFISPDEAAGHEKDCIDRYKVLEYNNMFDKKNVSSLFDINVSGTSGH